MSRKIFGLRQTWVMLLFAVLTGFCVAGTLGAGAMEIRWLSGVSKMAASVGFLGMALAAGALQTRYGLCVLLGLIFSWFGDLFLFFSHPSLFLAGLVAFLLGHLAYSVAFTQVGLHTRTTIAALIVMSIVGGGVLIWLWPHLGSMRIPVLAYCVVISAMVVLAFGAWRGHGTFSMPLAAVLFYASDLFVARARFVSPDWWNPVVGLPLYYGGQLVFAYSAYALLERLRQDSRRRV